MKIFIRFLSFTGLYCLNSHAPVEVGILLIFCIRDTDTYPIFVSIFIIFNYGHNSETLWPMGPLLRTFELFDGTNMSRN